MLLRILYVLNSDPSISASSLLDRTTWKISPSNMYLFALSTMLQYFSLSNSGLKSLFILTGSISAISPSRMSFFISSISASAFAYPASISDVSAFAMRISFDLKLSNAMTLSNNIRSRSWNPSSSSASITSFFSLYFM